MEELGERLRNLKSTGTPQYLTESANLGPRELSETESPTEEQSVSGKRLFLHVGPPNNWSRAVPEPVACPPVDPVPLNGQPCLASAGGNVPGPAVT